MLFQNSISLIARDDGKEESCSEFETQSHTHTAHTQKHTLLHHIEAAYLKNTHTLDFFFIWCNLSAEVH